jgi:hypothetical protein
MVRKVTLSYVNEQGNRIEYSQFLDDETVGEIIIKMDEEAVDDDD